MKKLRKVSSREYKVMLDHRFFADRKPAVSAFREELGSCLNRLGLGHQGDFATAKKREIVFLDTVDQTIALNRFIFRQRRNLANGKCEYTLKCRSPDRYVAAHADVSSANGVKSKRKFEEDIAVPFVSRYSHSNSVRGPEQAPSSLKQAGELFPVLSQLMRDGERCSEKLALRPVNSLAAHERVFAGPVLKIGATEAEVAIILWSDGKRGRPLVAEFSFRYGRHGESYRAEVARLAMEFFEVLQRLDWCLPEGKTKTQFAYHSA